MVSDEKNAIRVENLHLSLSNDECNEIIDLFNFNKIDIIFFDTRNSPKASLFDAITILFNEPLTKTIIANLLSSATYDVIKSVLYRLFRNKKQHIIYNLSSKEKEASVNLHFETDSVQIIAPIPDNLNKKQFSGYMDMLHKTMVELGKHQIPNIKTQEILNKEKNNDSLTVKTILQYSKERHKEQQKNKDNSRS
jgi:Mg/Co/Ni transporter MgtE